MRSCGVGPSDARLRVGGDDDRLGRLLHAPEPHARGGHRALLDLHRFAQQHAAGDARALQVVLHQVAVLTDREEAGDVVGGDAEGERRDRAVVGAVPERRCGAVVSDACCLWVRCERYSAGC